MKVKDLIEKLKDMPQEAEVFHLWDGHPRTCINVVYESKNGKVVTADYEQACYSDIAIPKGVPTPREYTYWQTEKAPSDYNICGHLFDDELLC